MLPSGESAAFFLQLPPQGPISPIPPRRPILPGSHSSTRVPPAVRHAKCSRCLSPLWYRRRTARCGCAFSALSDGQTIAANPGEPIRITAEASGVPVIGISLGVQPGEFAKFVENTANADPFRTEFSWLPGLGSGTYPLTLETLTADKSEVGVSCRSGDRPGGRLALAPSARTWFPPDVANQDSESSSKSFGVDPTRSRHRAKIP